MFTAKRMGPRPADLPDAEIAEGAGELGHFSPAATGPSSSPFARRHRCWAAIVGIWLVLLGIVATLATVTGLLFEHYVTRLAIEQD